MTLSEYKEKIVKFLEENPDCGEMEVIEYYFDKWEYVRFAPQVMLMYENEYKYKHVFDELPRGCIGMPVKKVVTL